jgi:uncharacterized membrane protein
MKSKEKLKWRVFYIFEYMPLALSVLLVFLFSCISLYRYFTLQVFHYDLGIFAETIWRLSRFTIPILHHIDFGTINFLGDHFNPSIVLLVPLFWVVHDVWILLIEQVVVTVASGYLIYVIARKHGLNLIPAIVMQILFVLFAGIENPLVTDWHTEPTAGLFLLLFYYFFVFTKKRIAYLFCAIIFLGFKESNPTSFCLLLIPLFFTMREKRKEIILLGTTTILYFFLITKFVIPYFNGQAYFYLPEMPHSISGFLQSVTRTEKYVFVLQSILSFAFLILLSGVWILPVLGEMAMRILPVSSFFQVFTLGMHYNVFLGIFLSLAAIHGFIRLRGLGIVKKYEKTVITIILLFSLFIAQKFIHPPIDLTINPVFWREFYPRREISHDFKRVPSEGSIAAQNNILPYVLFRKSDVFMIRKKYLAAHPDIIVFDLSEGQNPNNFFPVTRDFFNNEKKGLLQNKLYHRITTENKDLYIFTKN